MDAAIGSNPPARKPVATMGGKLDPVTAGLKKMFEVIAEEPIPDEFLRLLDEIEASGKKAGETSA